MTAGSLGSSAGLKRMSFWRACAVLSPLALAPLASAHADPTVEAPSQTFGWHVQSTLVDQATAGFASPYRGPNSLDPAARGRETFDLTLFAGASPWSGAEVWINPEIDQGFGLSDTLGAAGFPSGEAYKVGKAHPYYRTQRLFFRQTLNLGGEASRVEADQNVLAASQTANRLVLTLGKFSVGDVFDTNRYAHDPRGDFFNWTAIDAATFDYAADAWGYSQGAAGEWYQGAWTARLGLFAMSRIPNGEHLDSSFGQFQTIAEGERRFDLWGQPGALKLTGYLSRARMGTYAAALDQAAPTGRAPDVLGVKRYASHAGISLNLQQQVSPDLGLFARAGLADGHQQAYEFTDVDKSLSLGASLSGARWGRGDDAVGAVLLVNDISHDFRAYLAAGGLGILVGDGKLPNKGAETIVETYYNLAAFKGVHVTGDYQLIVNPAYNADRGPVSVLALRLHAGL